MFPSVSVSTAALNGVAGIYDGATNTKQNGIRGESAIKKSIPQIQNALDKSVPRGTNILPNISILLYFSQLTVHFCFSIFILFTK